MTSSTCCWTSPVSVLMRMTRSRLVIRYLFYLVTPNVFTDGAGYRLRGCSGQARNWQRFPTNLESLECRSALEHVDFHGLDVDPDLLQPPDSRRDIGALAFQLQTNDSDFVRHTGLTDVGDDFEPLAQLPDNRVCDHPRRIHQPKPGFLRLAVRAARSPFRFQI